jgi:hypothetical protein
MPADTAFDGLLLHMGTLRAAGAEQRTALVDDSYSY